eukprot:12651006-Ditylum_brightwellii.AAC.1
MMGKSFAQDEYPSVFESEWNGLFFQLNITQYLWLYAFVDFDNKSTTLHDSDPIVQKSLEVNTGADQIIEKIEDLRIKDLDIEEGKREEPQQIIAEHDWYLYLSTDMPQQHRGNMNCALHTSQGCDILSKVDSLESFTDNDDEWLEDHSRKAAVCLIASNSPNDIQSSEGEEME